MPQFHLQYTTFNSIISMNKIASIVHLSVVLMSIADAAEIQLRDTGPIYELVKTNSLNAFFEDAIVKFKITGGLEYGGNENDISPSELIQLLSQNSCRPKLTTISKTDTDNLDLVLEYICLGPQDESYKSTSMQILFAAMLVVVCLSICIVVLRARNSMNEEGERGGLQWRLWRVPLRRGSSFDHKTSRTQIYEVGSNDSLYTDGV